MNKPCKIIQTSPQHTGSTVLVNLIHGFLLPREGVKYLSHLATATERNEYINKYFIIKTHDIRIDNFIKDFKNCNMYFIVSLRDNYDRIDSKYQKYDNVLIIDYSEINETEENSLKNIVNVVFNKLKTFLPNDILPKKNDTEIKNSMFDRIASMNKTYEEIRHKSFEYHDKFYHIHGNHRAHAKTIVFRECPKCGFTAGPKHFRTVRVAE